MKLSEVLCCLSVVVALSDAFPKPGYFPRSYMIGGSFYANPRYAREGPGYEYLPPGQMTAMVVGDTVATNSFSGSPFNPPHVSIPVDDVGQIEGDQVSEQVTEKQQPFLIAIPEPDSINETEPEEISEQPEPNIRGGEQETFNGIDDVTTETIVPTTKIAIVKPSRAPSSARKGKVGKAKRPVPVAPVAPPKPAEEDEDEDSELPASWPFAGMGKGGSPGYNAFFPIYIGGGASSGRSRTRASGAPEEGYPGSATAIANAFSTGKGGVATSHATSFGDPYVAAMLRNSGFFNFKTKTAKKQPLFEEDDE